MSTLEVRPVSVADPSIYVNRDLSLLEFQRRVLDEAQDENNPLLERIKFLAIFGSNMDEFFMLRVSGIPKYKEAQWTEASLEGMHLSDEFTAVRKLSSELYTTALQCLHEEILPKLEKSGVYLLDYAELSKRQKERIHNYFKKTIYPLLIPLPLSYGHPFPHISNLYLNLAVVLQDRKGSVKLMRLQVPDTLPRLFPVKRSSSKARKNGKASYSYSFIWLEQIIIDNLEDVFPDVKILAVHPFRIIRDAALRLDELDRYDPLDDVEESIQQLNIQRREFGAVMQVAIYPDMPDSIRNLLTEILKVDPQDLFVKGNPLGLRSLWQLYTDIERDDLKYREYKPAVPKVLQHISKPQDIFAAIRAGNILLHHPYDSFSPVVDFLTL